MSNNEDLALKKEFDTLAMKLAENPANADIKITNHEEVANLMKLKKKRVCWSCRRANCFTKQVCSSKLKMKKKFLDNCEGKSISFKELKESKPSTPTATAQITSPAPADSNSDNDDIAQAFTHMNSHSQNEEVGYNDNIAECSID